MTLNEFNSKVNLPRLSAKLGYPIDQFDFIKIAPFGWFARSRTNDFIGNVFDFFQNPEDLKNLYTLIVENYQDCLDFNLPNSSWANRHLARNILIHSHYQALWSLSREQLKKHRARYNSKVYYFEDILCEMGLPGLAENGIGCLTPEIAKSFPKLGLDKQLRNRKVVVIPSFVTPKHICSIELAPLHNLEDRSKVYVNGEIGWYGKIGEPIYGSFADLKVVPGVTWNRKLDFWVTKPLEISQSVTTPQLIQIWSETRRSEFSKNPIEMLLAKQGSETIENHLGTLSYEQVQSLEKLTGAKLLPSWIEARQQQFVIQGRTFSRRGSSYYLVKDEDAEQLTNFTMDIKEIRKRKKDNDTVFVWCGFINVGEAVVPFELEDRYFTSSHLFTRGVREQFLTLGLGIPYINQRFIGQIMNIIQMASHNVEIVSES
jgi:hypothetical protein